jgi:hypothetical protein
MTLFVRFFKGWLILVFVILFFVGPLYTLAIYPDIPSPRWGFLRGYGAGPVGAEASLTSFLLRLAYCGGVVALGLAIAWKWLGGSARKSGSGRRGAPHAR